MKVKLKKQSNMQLIFESDKYIELKVGKYYTLKEYKKNRTLDQNAMLWSILTQISQFTGQNNWKLYLELLQKTNIFIQWLEAPAEAEESLKRIYRIVEKKENRISNKGVKTCLFKCYVGSSEFNTNEMKILIDEALFIAEDLQIKIDLEDF